LLHLSARRPRPLGAGRPPLRPCRGAARAAAAVLRPAHRRAGPGGALGDRVPPLPAPAGRSRAAAPPRAPRGRTLPLRQLLPPLRAHDARAPRGRDRGLRGRRDLAALRVPLQAGRPRAGPALRRPAPAAGRLPALVPAPRPAAPRALLRHAARAPADGPGGRGAALRPRPVPDDAAPFRAGRDLPLPVHRRRPAARARRLVGTRARGPLAAARRREPPPLITTAHSSAGRQRPPCSTSRRGGAAFAG